MPLKSGPHIVVFELQTNLVYVECRTFTSREIQGELLPDGAMSYMDKTRYHDSYMAHHHLSKLSTMSDNLYRIYMDTYGMTLSSGKFL